MGKIILNGTGYGGSGGSSGGHTIVDPTGTDMPQEDKLKFTGAVSVSDDSANGQTVVNVEGGGNYYLNTIFSTEEKKIGYWTDKKPLYQKTFETNYTSNGTYSIDISSLNADTICNSFGEYNRSNGEWTEFNHYSNSSYYGELRASATQVRMFLQLPESNPQGKQFSSIQYTKTTDTADPNPQFGNVIYLPTIYSEEERQVGVWRGGKPLYQKTIIQNNATLNSEVSIDVSTLNIDKCIWVGGVYSRNVSQYGQTLTYPFNNYELSNYNSFIRYTDSTKSITYKIALATGNTTDYQSITLQYTKTTDTAGSGSWTPSGANAVHYDGNEKVIGTWFGETLYEKTVFNNGSDITANAGAWTAICSESWVANVKTIINGVLTRQGTLGDTLVTPVEFNAKDNAIRINPFRNTTYKANGYFTIQYTKN